MHRKPYKLEFKCLKKPGESGMTIVDREVGCDGHPYLLQPGDSVWLPMQGFGTKSDACFPIQKQTSC